MTSKRDDWGVVGTCIGRRRVRDADSGALRGRNDVYGLSKVS